MAKANEWIKKDELLHLLSSNRITMQKNLDIHMSNGHPILTWDKSIRVTQGELGDYLDLSKNECIMKPGINRFCETLGESFWDTEEGSSAYRKMFDKIHAMKEEGISENHKFNATASVYWNDLDKVWLFLFDVLIQ